MIRFGSLMSDPKQQVRRAASSAFDAVMRPAIATPTVIAALEFRARRRGTSDTLIERSRLATARTGVRAGIAMLRLLCRVAEGDHTAIRPLIDKLKPELPDDCMWDALELAGIPCDDVRDDPNADLVVHFEGEIRRGFVDDAHSDVLEWLLSTGRVSGDHATLRALLDTLVDTSLNVRRNELLATPMLSIDDLLPLVAQFSVGTVFLSGASLLRATHSEARWVEFGPAELGTFEPLDDALADLPLGLTIRSRHVDHALLVHDSTGHEVVLVAVAVDNGRAHHGNGRYTRWYTPFEVEHRTIRGVSCTVPVDTTRYLTERFGDRPSDLLFFDPVLDAPNTTIDDTLDGLLFIYSKVRTCFATGERHYADEWSALLRDRFGIDYANFVPRGVHPKVLATPPEPGQLAGRRVQLIVADFDQIDAAFLGWIDSVLDLAAVTVAGVVGHRSDQDAIERLAMARSLASMQHVALIEHDDDLERPIPGVRPSEIVVHPSSRVPTTP